MTTLGWLVWTVVCLAAAWQVASWLYEEWQRWRLDRQERRFHAFLRREDDW